MKTIQSTMPINEDITLICTQKTKRLICKCQSQTSYIIKFNGFSVVGVIVCCRSYCSPFFLGSQLIDKTFMHVCYYSFVHIKLQRDSSQLKTLINYQFFFFWYIFFKDRIGLIPIYLYPLRNSYFRFQNLFPCLILQGSARNLRKYLSEK